MFLNQLLDHVNKIIKRKAFSAMNTEASLTEFVKIVGYAERFDFGDLPFEARTNTTYALPKLTEDEEGFWRDRLIPVPAPISWYEFSIRGIRSGILIVSSPSQNGAYLAQRVEMASHDLPILIDGTWVELSLDKVQLYNNNQRLLAAINKLPDDQIAELYASNIRLAIYMTLMINSKSTERRSVQPSAAQNRLRRQLGRSELKSHTVVTIVPQSFLREAAAAKGGTHASPKLHWRRSHVRVLHRDTAQEKRIVIPRFLVGRSDLGTVDHDYVVHMEPRHVTAPVRDEPEREHVEGAAQGE